VADLTRRTLPAPLSDADRDRLWGDLAGDAKVAHRTVYELIAAGPDAVADLERRLQPVPAEAPPIDNLLADLGSERFAAREEATKALGRMGPAIEPALRKALEGKPSAEARSRIERLLDRLRAEESRQQRAVAVLAAVDTPEARKLLHKLAEGAPAAGLTRAAKAAIERLERPAVRR
jgi:hypothetical protein